MADKKFVLLEETIEHEGVVLHRIEAVKSFGEVQEGELGGFVEKEENLSHEGNCWVKDYAKVYGNATVSDDAVLSEYAIACGNAKVYGASAMSAYAKVSENAEVFENAEVSGYAKVAGNVKIHKYSSISAFENLSGDEEFAEDDEMFRRIREEDKEDPIDVVAE